MKEIRALYAEAARFRERRAALARELVQVDERHAQRMREKDQSYQSEIQTLEQEKAANEARARTRAEREIQAYSAKKNSLAGYLTAVERWCATTFSNYVPQPERVDEAELNDLLAKLEEGGFLAWIKRTFRLGGYASRAEMARELFEKIQDATAYCQERIDECQMRYVHETQEQATVTRRKRRAAEEKYAQTRQELTQQRDRERKAAQESIERFDNAAELAQMHESIRKRYAEGEQACGAWGSFQAPSAMPERVMLCNAGIVLPDRTGTDKELQLPLWLDLYESNIIVITGPNGPSGGPDCTEKLLVRKILARLLKTVPPEDIAFSVFDALYKGSSLERLIDVTNVGTTDLSFDLFTSKDGSEGGVTCAERRKYLRGRPAEINRYMAGHTTSLFEFNRERGGSDFPFTWIVDFDFPEKIDDRFAEDLKELLVNADAAGYSFIFVAGPKGLEHLRSVVRQYSKRPLIHLDCSRGLCVLDDLSVRFTEKGAPDTDQIYNFMTALKDHYVKGAAISNRIDDVFEKHGVERREAAKKLTVPMAIDSRGRLVDLMLGGEGSVHGFVSGSTNSGKSTLLHSVILSACLHYSPEDLEIWLVDYKQTELILYRKDRPPHVKLIGLSKTPDFTFSLLDKIEKEAARRTELMNFFGEQNMEGYWSHKGEPGYVHFPRLFLIVDEFHEMSQFVASETTYKDKLENILREYRAQGITCLLADQTFSSGLSGLTPAAKNQIGLRIAMRNETSPQEIRDTLEVDRALYSDSMQRAISLMSQGDFIMKVYVRDAAGKITDIRLEKFKALWTMKTDIRPVAAALRTIWPEYVNDKDLIYVNTNEQAPWSDEEPEALDRMVPIRYPDLRLYLGRSATLQPCFGLDMGRQPNENLSIVGGTAYQRWELIAAIMRSCAYKGYKLLVFMAEWSDLYSDHGAEIRELCATVPGARLMESAAEWCAELTRLETVVDERRKDEDIICIFIGLDVADMEMSRLPDREGGRIGAGSFRSSFSSSPRPSAPRAPAKPGAGSAASLMSAQMLAAIGAVPADDEAERFIASGRMSAAPEQPPEPERPEEFNAMPILDKLFSQGSRCGIRCIAEVSVYRQFSKILKIREMCKHKVAFSMSADDCLMYLGNSNFQKSIGQFAVYSDGGKEIKKLLPYRLVREKDREGTR